MYLSQRSSGAGFSLASSNLTLFVSPVGWSPRAFSPLDKVSINKGDVTSLSRKNCLTTFSIVLVFSLGRLCLAFWSISNQNAQKLQRHRKQIVSLIIAKAPDDLNLSLYCKCVGITKPTMPQPWQLYTFSIPSRVLSSRIDVMYLQNLQLVKPPCLTC